MFESDLQKKSKRIMKKKSNQESFINEQKELIDLQKQFSNVMNDLKGVFPQIQEEMDPLIEEEDAQDLMNRSELTHIQEIKVLIDDIVQIERDLSALKDTINSKKTSDRVRVAKINSRIEELTQILNSQLFRAQRLLR